MKADSHKDFEILSFQCRTRHWFLRNFDLLKEVRPELEGFNAARGIGSYVIAIAQFKEGAVMVVSMPHAALVLT